MSMPSKISNDLTIYLARARGDYTDRIHSKKMSVYIERNLSRRAIAAPYRISVSLSPSIEQRDLI